MAVNKVILLGNLGSDVNVRHLPDGRPVGNVNIATTETFRDQEGGKRKHTEWHRLVFFGRQAEVASEYLRKGSSIYVEGTLRTRRWTDKEDVERQTTEIRVLFFQMLGGRGDRDRGDSSGSSGSSGGSGDSGGYQRSPATDGGGSGSGSGGGSGGKPASGGFDDMDEDIPW